MKPISILLADDHTIVREGLAELLQHEGLCLVVAQAADGIEAVEKALATRPQVAVIDLSMPRLHGLEVVRRIHQELPDTRLLVLTHHDEEEYVLPIVEAGASGYLIKDSAATELRAAVRALADNQAYFGPMASKVLAQRHRHPRPESSDPYGDLTPREREVFHLVCEGHSTKEVARLLGISVKTAENHRGRILDKLQLANTAEMVRYAARKGLID